MLGLDHAFFQPLWIRIVVVTVCFGWAAFEFATGAPFWGVIFAGIGAAAGWQFFLSGPSEGEDQK